MREASTDDAPAIAALDARVNASPWSADAVRETLQRAGGFVFCMPDGALAGFVLFTVVADECEILDIAIDPEYRRAGRASRLLEAAQRAAADRGATRCLLEVRESNASAQAFYHSAGFAVTGRRRDYYRTTTGREDALLMSRSIARENGSCPS
ncbi:MAG: ribosomal protein S18-alanine N-acetyltransferase [Pseudomonadales bacterium]|jgi:ribosomal-protein-alanine N-acetyltransferase|nr:ribosomal protein S18-alanine N-acetyltransferase [Pseudomonadales bacterium]